MKSIILRELDLKNTRVRKLKNGDWIIRWKRPTKPKEMDRKEYETYAEEMEHRLINTKELKNGFQAEPLYVVTNLMETDLYPTNEIADLYVIRWNVELDFRSIKTAMGLEFLRAGNPHIVRLELKRKLD